ncbi:MAG: hypothetical protein LCH52_05600 [Bacteroidetes bacterium]|nr:hypothetical protein [Bacteroidota bacterium]
MNKKPRLEDQDKPLLLETPETIIDTLATLKYVVVFLFIIAVSVPFMLNRSGGVELFPIVILIIAGAFLVLSIAAVEKLFIFLFQIREALYHQTFDNYGDEDEEKTKTGE